MDFESKVSQELYVVGIYTLDIHFSFYCGPNARLPRRRHCSAKWAKSQTQHAGYSQESSRRPPSAAHSAHTRFVRPFSQSASLGIPVNPVLRLLLRGEGRGFVGEDESIIDKACGSNARIVENFLVGLTTRGSSLWLCSK
jgi:hypothetical protein